ncbi:MAG: 2-hydroxyacyl-CoA dehydratase family protein [Tissierellia bacterium]|nr:2-hydroxyacyl-CoA dehydratase family protein [Tissierellia bacterium]
MEFNSNIIIDKWLRIQKETPQYLNKMSKERELIGWVLEYCPEEIIHALNCHPIPLWGEGLKITLSNRYFPSFYCQPIRSILEQGMRGELDHLKAVLAPSLCDSLKAFGQNWKVAVPQIPIIQFVHPQNRKAESAISFLVGEYQSIIDQLSMVIDRKWNLKRLSESIQIYELRNKLVRNLIETIAERDDCPYSLQVLVYHMSRVLRVEDFVADAEILLKDLDSFLPSGRLNPSIMLIGITADNNKIIEAIDQSRLKIVSDDLANGNRQVRTAVDLKITDPIEALAIKWRDHIGCCLAYSPEKERIDFLKERILEKGIQGVIFSQMSFCDPEEYDYPLIRDMLVENGIPHLTIQLTDDASENEQLSNRIEAFAEVLKAR